MTVAPKHTVPRVLGRFAAGKPLDGIRRTNATWLRRATLDLTEHQRSARWHHLPGWHRSAYRLGAATGTIGFLAGMLGWGGKFRLLTMTVVCGAVLTTLVLVAFRIRSNMLMWSHRRHVVYPLWHMIATATGYPVNLPHTYQSVPGSRAGHPGYARRESPEKFLSVPRDYQNDLKSVIWLALPFTWEAHIAQQKTVLSIIEKKLGGEWSPDWSLDTSPKTLTLRHAPAPPERVLFDDFRPYMDASEDHVLPLGFNVMQSVASIDLDSESPHVALSMGTGGGKSDTTALIIAFLVNRECERIDIIDPKRVSHNWARGLPGVYIHKYVQQQMEAIHDTRLAVDHRYEQLDNDETVIFTRRVLVIEEQNSLIEDLNEYWEDYRRELSSQERSRVPRQNPAIRDLKHILNKGRQCRINVISIYQRMSAVASGGGDMRENYGAKLLARYSSQTWKILVGTPFIRPSRIPGRGMLVIGDEAHAIQRAFAGIADSSGRPDQEGIARLRAYALKGRPDTRTAPRTAESVAEVMAAIESQADEIALVSLREACDAGILRMRLPAARKARQRDKTFPPGKPGDTGGIVHATSELRAWQDSRDSKRLAA